MNLHEQIKNAEKTKALDFILEEICNIMDDYEKDKERDIDELTQLFWYIKKPAHGISRIQKDLKNKIENTKEVDKINQYKELQKDIKDYLSKQFDIFLEKNNM